MGDGRGGSECRAAPQAPAMAAGGLDGAGTLAGTANAWAPDADLSAQPGGRAEGTAGAPGGPSRAG